jgi:hypothetical protein
MTYDPDRSELITQYRHALALPRVDLGVGEEVGEFL